MKCKTLNSEAPTPVVLPDVRPLVSFRKPLTPALTLTQYIALINIY